MPCPLARAVEVLPITYPATFARELKELDAGQ
jgi:hypothetical protein